MVLSVLIHRPSSLLASSLDFSDILPSEVISRSQNSSQGRERRACSPNHPNVSNLSKICPRGTVAPGVRVSLALVRYICSDSAMPLCLLRQ